MLYSVVQVLSSSGGDKSGGGDVVTGLWSTIVCVFLILFSLTDLLFTSFLNGLYCYWNMTVGPSCLQLKPESPFSESFYSFRLTRSPGSWSFRWWCSRWPR